MLSEILRLFIANASITTIIVSLSLFGCSSHILMHLPITIISISLFVK